MAEIKTNDRLGERGRDRGYVEDRERIVRSKHLTRTIDHLVDPDPPPLRAAEHSIRGGSREFSTWKLIMLPHNLRPSDAVKCGRLPSLFMRSRPLTFIPLEALKFSTNRR